jgi:HAD superfamily hydrolase (TIGR01549 family)
MAEGKQMNHSLKAILFDMGSTLLEFENYTWEVLGRSCAENSYRFLRGNGIKLPQFEEFGLMLRDEFLKARAEVEENLKEFKFEQVAGNIFHLLDLSTSDGLYHRFVEVYYQPVTDQLTLINGAVEILRYFKNQNLKIGIISNTIFPERFHLLELKRFGLYPYLDFHIFSSTIGVRKPHPRIFQEALDNLMIDSSRAVFVGDRLVEDVGGAQKVGIKGILKYHEGRDYTAPIIPDAQIENLNELKEVISSIS